jgi:hypothetical protein
MEEMRNECRILFINLKGRNYLGHLQIDGKILKWRMCKGVDWIQLAQNRV